MKILNLPLNGDRRSHGKAPFIRILPAEVIDRRLEAYKAAAAQNNFTGDELTGIFDTAKANATRRTLTRA
ncbi:hypothetical protein UNPF46_11515 [Bradyrhizobium sp. UNPF46]|uniref:hypothetical protein n=1 Tax=Bradyrhizobium sp. UNPF46 TaxID=1141168 RepID=UPI001153DA63|nr:hypothetical protein [Bradyrhizobium sp. UNPF46]TQF40086.1 hypothetical protein UNPF46_11515 [Bradyrhizobium sp. UNPF46]